MKMSYEVKNAEKKYPSRHGLPDFIIMISSILYSDFELPVSNLLDVICIAPHNDIRR